MIFGLDLPSWEHVALVFLAITAIAAVGSGVASFAVIKLQRSEAAQSKADFDEYKAGAAERTAAADQRAAEANARAGQANQAAAEANARAEQANLELQRLRLMRSIDHGKLVGWLAGKPKWPVIELLYVDDQDSSFLASSILVGLAEAGWGTPTPRRITGPNPNWEHSRVLGDIVQITSTWGAQGSGVSVVSTGAIDPDGRSPAVTLWTAISQSISEGQTNLGRDTSMPADTIRIVIAPRR